MTSTLKNITFCFAFCYSITFLNAQSEIRFEAKQIHSESTRILEEGINSGYWICIQLSFLNTDSIEIKTFCFDDSRVNPSSLHLNIPGNNRKGINKGRKADPLNYLNPIQLLPNQAYVDTVFIALQHPIALPVEADLTYTLRLFPEKDLVAVRNDATLEYCLNQTNEMKTKVLLER